MRVTGRLEAIWIKPAHRGPMEPARKAVLRAGAGIAGNVHRGGRRQVTIICWEAWQAVVGDLDARVDPVVRRANLMVSGISLAGSRLRVIRIGPCRIRIQGETRPCERMDTAHPGLRRALESDWRGGAYGEVLDNGEIVVGDPAVWADG
jgi:MOSC domain-containing protein YiiM